MAGMTAYILDDTGRLICTRSGDIENVMLAIEIEETPYTIAVPPDGTDNWRWVNNEWVEDKQEEVNHD